MFVEESRWVRNILETISIEPGCQVLDIGSSSYTFRTKIQPHITENVFEPLLAKKCRITYLDVKKEEGIDIVADLTSSQLDSQTFAKKYDIILCCNLLEHIRARNAFIANMSRFTDEGSFILLTAPRKYFRHDDPIYTMYRPTPTDLFSLLEEHMRILRVSQAVISTSDRNNYIFKLGRLLDYFPFRPYRHYWRLYAKPFRWQVSCVLARVSGG